MNTNGTPPRPEGGDDELNLQELWYGLLRNRWLVLGVTLAVTALMAFYTWRQRPVYASAATLSIQDRSNTQSALSDLMPMMGGGSSLGRLETEMVVLRSRGLAERVVDSLGLSLVVTQPAGPRSRVLRILSAPPETEPGSFVLRHRSGSEYELTAEKAPRGVRLPGTVRIGTPFEIGKASLALAPSLSSSPPSEIRFDLVPYQNAVTMLQRSLVVSRVDPKAQVLAVRYQSVDPELAAQVPNALTDIFIAHKANWSKTESRSTVTFLREQVEQYEQQLVAAENQLRGFREREQVVSPQEEASQQVRRLAELQAERDRFRAEREALAKLLSRVDDTAPREGAQYSSPYRQLASFPVFLSNKAVQDMLQSLTALENSRAELLVRRTPANDDVRGYDQRIQEMELQLYQIARNYLEGLDSQIASAEQNLSRFGGQLELIPAREVEFARLSRQQKLLGELYTLLQTRLKEAEINEAVESTEVRVIDEALTPRIPISPRPLRNLALGIMLGLGMGMAAAFAREKLDTKVRTREDVTEATSGMPVLALIPRIRVGAEAAAAGRNRLAGVNGNGHGREVQAPVVQIAPFSPASEAFRALRTSLAFVRLEGAPQVVVVTSAMPGEGKSTNSVNLALSQAQQGTRTLLVDADLRRGVLHRTLGTRQEPGLTNVLLAGVPLDEAIVQVPSGEEGTTLDFLPAGVFPPNPAELLGSEKMAALIAELRGRYGMIIFDAAPLNLVTDAAVLAKQCDSALLVTRTGFSDKRSLHHAAWQLQQVRARVGGVVMNDVDVEGSGRYYGYGYGSGYGYAYGDYAAVSDNGSNGNGKNRKNGKHG